MVMNQDEDVESLSINKDKQKSDVFGLWVKLKIPKEEGMDFGDQEIGPGNKNRVNTYSNDMKRVCHICQKAFSSGKALGGHMRIHVQQLANKKDLVFKKKLKVNHTITFKNQNPRESSEEKVPHSEEKKHHHCRKKPTSSTMTAANCCGGGSGDTIQKPVCIICGKDFPSMKALFGHMRCHPERDWRGIHPPSSFMVKKGSSSSSSSSLSDYAAEPPKISDRIGLLASGAENRAVDLTESLMSWPVTAKRGRKAVAAGSSSELSSSDDDQLLDAVNYLMMLAQGRSVESDDVTPKQSFGESEAANSSCRGEILEINRLSKLKRRMMDQSSVGIGNEQRDSNEVGKAVNEESDIVRGESVNKLGGDHDRNCASDDDDDQTDSKRKLSDRDIESTNFKAMTSIKNKKKRKKMKLCDLKPAGNASPVDDKVVGAALPHDKYRCNTCDKSFPTHQALGGHRSSHNKLNVTKDDVKRGVTSSKNVSISQALEGDHKRSNDSGLVEAQSSQAPSTSETNHMCGKVLDFDLNEVPPSEDGAGFESELGLGSFDYAYPSL